jgi:DNA-binding NtrC family response regulator
VIPEPRPGLVASWLVSDRKGEPGETVLQADTHPVRHTGYRLVVLTGELRGREIDVLSEVITIGKSRTCEVVFPDDSVSRVHAELRREGDLYRFRDRNSTNGSFVGGARITDAYLKPGDVVGVGKVQMRFLPRDARAELLPSENERFGEVIGLSLAMRKIFGVLERIAKTDVTVLLQGETGTGKDLVARTMHEASHRCDGPFVVVDCGAVAPDLIEGELLGHESGGATGAQRRQGAFELARGGTLFLDEIGELPRDLQPKLLRVLETQRLRRVGGTEEIETDVRVIAATHRDLKAQVEKEEFREDFYFRLAVVAPQIPPLRERRDDIPALIEHFSRRLPAGMWKAPDPEAMARLVGYQWPGNVRELRNVVERSAYLSPNGVIDLVTTGRRRDASEEPVAFDPTMTFREQKERATELFEEAYLQWLLQRAEGNISRAAREADMDRKYLHKLLRRYGIEAKLFGRR